MFRKSIRLRKFDPANGEMMSAFLINATPFAESPYDYLILLLLNDNGDVIPNALKFPRRGLRNIFLSVSSNVAHCSE